MFTCNCACLVHAVEEPMLTQHCFEGEAVSCTFSETVPGKVSQHLSEGLYARCNSTCCKDTVCSAALHATVIAHNRCVTANETTPCNVCLCLPQNCNTVIAELQHHRPEQQPYVGNEPAWLQFTLRCKEGCSADLPEKAFLTANGQSDHC